MGVVLVCWFCVQAAVYRCLINGYRDANCLTRRKSAERRKKMKARELINLGIPKGSSLRTAQVILARLPAVARKRSRLRDQIQAVARNPDDFTDDPIWSRLARELQGSRASRNSFEPRQEPAPWRQWGQNLDANAVKQLQHASRLPVALRGALMPDAHLGYGLPIGGVLGTENAVIPYAVGMDIACRMKMTVLDLPPGALEGRRQRLRNALIRETNFGVGASYRADQRLEHSVMDEDWRISPVTASGKDKAWSQLGTSGSGNHFVEFGTLTLPRPDLGLEAGTYLALLSHSGSRGTGASVAQHYSRLAMDLHPELPKELIHLAWLDLQSQPGREYWLAMELMGRYASANHELIHRKIARSLGVSVLADIENHHNFAWKELHDGREVVVHRKGATPAGEGVLGIIPGSMADPGFVVRGKGSADAMNSASHGAGRRMSRKQAKQSFRWSDAREVLDRRKVELISAGLDEVPMAYKDIREVMAAQDDLVRIVAEFQPRMVRMAKGGKAED